MAPTTAVNPLKYPRSQSAAFSQALFQNPSAEYRGCPLWSWNGKLDDDKLRKQIQSFEQMGMGGFHMHSRVGLDTKYLSDEFFHAVRVSADEANSRSMLTCLYDEDRWPSGCAGGLVTMQDESFKAKHVLVTKYPYGRSKYPPHRIGYGPKGKGARSENGKLVARYSIKLNADGIATYRQLMPEEEADDDTWHAYLETNPPADWYNSSTYVDCMNQKATKAFLESTHEKYRQVLASQFGQATPSIFADEPQIEHRGCKASSFDDLDLLLPWGEAFRASFEDAYGYDFISRLPEFLWDTDSATSLQTRSQFNEHATERFIDGFHDTVSRWCAENGILFTGHQMMEPTLDSQTVALGEAMRTYRSMGLPGIDLLCDKIEFNTAKQAVSMARQNAIVGAASEIYGVTNWTFTFEGHKGCGDWQAALGITFRVHHLAPYTLLGEAKRDYPAAISYQSPWYKEYALVEDYFARVGVALTRGQPITRVGVIHPVESYWLCFGPRDRNRQEQQGRDAAFKDLTDWLLHGLIDFDFISESQFPHQTALDDITASHLPVGSCEYDTVIVANCRTLRSTTLERLQRFAHLGGRIIVTGENPSLIDAAEPQQPPHISGAVLTPFMRHSILKALTSNRDLDIIMHNRPFEQPFLYQMRRDGEEAFLFICNMNRHHHYDTTVRIKGNWAVSVLDAITGKEWQARAFDVRGWTELKWTFECTGSVLLRLSRSVSVNGHGSIIGSSASGQDQLVYRNSFKKAGSVRLESVELSEPNVLLLDRASFRIEGQDHPWSEATEVLRIDNLARERMGVAPKGEGVKQPWAFTPEERAPFGTLRLRFDFFCTQDIDGEINIAAEHLIDNVVMLDGEQLPINVNGWFVDEDIKTSAIVPTGAVLRRGRHTVELSYPFAVASSVERVYLLGKSFGVHLRGEEASMTRLDLEDLSFEDWTRKGLPFYAGNVTYNCIVQCPISVDSAALQLPELIGCPVASVRIATQPPTILGFSPFIAPLGSLSVGEHRVAITCFGNRENSFGAIHVPNGKTKWFGPDAWRTDHDWWTDAYNVKPMGLLSRPHLLMPGKEIYAAPRPTGEP